MNLPEPPRKPQPKPTGTIASYLIGILDGTRKFRVFTTFFVLSLLLAAPPSYKLFSTVLPFVENFNTKVETVVHEIFPQELEITIKNGQASTNVREPYYLTFSYATLQEAFDIKDSSRPISQYRLLAIDTAGTIEDFDHHQSYSLLTGSHLVYYSDGEMEIIDLDSLPDMTLTRQSILGKIDEINQDYYVTSIVKSLIYVAPILLFLLNMLTLLFATFCFNLLTRIIGKILMLDLSFGRLFSFTAALYTTARITTFVIDSSSVAGQYASWITILLYMAIPTAAYRILLKKRRL